MLPTNAVSIFQEYIDDIFIPYYERTTTFSRNDNLVWDVCLDNNLKGSTRDMRGTRRRVVPSAKLPANWKDLERLSSCVCK